MRVFYLHVFIAFMSVYAVCSGFPQEYDLVIRNGTIYDGSGAPPFVGDVAITADTIEALGTLDEASGRMEIDVTGLAVAPGFINMLSWATSSLLRFPRDLRA